MIRYSNVPSWTWGDYSRFGAWRHGSGLTLRYRAHLLHVRAFRKRPTPLPQWTPPSATATDEKERPDAR